jgi:hypothetical protein
VVLPFAGGLGETDHVLGHELVHAFQRDILKRAGRSLGLLPLWFSEGMAEYLSVGTVDTNTAMWVRDAVDADTLPTLEQLDHPKWFPYRYGQALWAHLSARFGEDLAARALVSTAKGGAIGRLTAVTGVGSAALSSGWHAALRETFVRRAPAAGPSGRAPVIVGGGKGAGRLNVSPALSPDGTQVVFLSERDGYSIDVFLADATTGAVIRTLVSTAADPHFDSLQFLESAGAWNPAGTAFALATIQRGHPVLTLLDMPGGVVRRERAFAELDQIFSPTWSPDGRRVAFSAMRGGTSDLYELDLERDVLRRLTADAYADLQPAWSPDGRTIAFVTDRFTSSLDALTFGHYRLAALDIASGVTRELPFIANAKHIDPQWHGQSLYFIADDRGISNVFRLDIGSGLLEQVTDAREGVSGLTGLSPALSVSARSGRIAFSEYERGAYGIRVTSAIPVTQVTAAEAERADEKPVSLSTSDDALATPEDTGRAGARRGATAGSDGTIETRPASRATRQTDGPSAASAVKGSIVTPSAAPMLTSLESKPYQRRLSLSGLGQPYVSAGGGMFGGFFRAGMSVAFSDLLEDRQVQTAVQFGASLDDFAIQSSYVNRQSRWNWGVIGGQIPVIFGSSRLSASEPGASTATITRETEALRQIHRQVTGVAMYPFSASKRLEISAGAHAIAFDREVATQVYSGATGRLLVEAEDRAPAGAPVALVDSAAAFVYDSSVFGNTGPVLGTRYRLEAAPTVGGLSFLTLTGDYRRYVMPVRPITLAFRVQHVGRYGRGAADPRLLPLVWSLRDLVRGYDPRGVLTTARMSIANAELRVPLIGTFGRLSGSTALPLDGLLFADAGAFDSAAADGTETRTRTMLRSAGAGVRLNAGGFVLEFDAVRTLDQAARGWTLAVNFRPGF